MNSIGFISWVGSIQELKVYNDWHILNHRLFVFLFTSFQLFSVHSNLQFYMKSNFYVWKCGFSKKFSSTRWFPPNWNSTLKGLISCGLLLDGHTPCSRNIFIKRGSVLQVFLIPFVVNSKGEKRNMNTKLLDNYLLLSTSALLTHFYRRFEFNSSLEFFKTDN